MKATQPEPEQWLPVPGYEGKYEASSLGRIRSLDHYVNAGGGRQRIAKGRVLKPFPANYYKVSLSGRRKCNVHTLVALAFLGPRPEGMEVCHNNGDRFDNRIENLRYDTHAENQLDVRRHGGRVYDRRKACFNGHEYIGDSFYEKPEPGGYLRRVCRVCERERDRARRAAA